MTAFLQVLDNPMQDIPLAALMHSEIGSFSAEDLAKIRAAFPQMSFHRAVLSLKDNRPDEMEEELYVRIRAFLAMLADYRKLVPDLPVYELISRILDETGFSALMSAAPDGEKRSANLSMLIARARSYENSSYHGLHNFNRYISNLKKYSMDYGEAEVLGEEEDAVTLMTIHKSKGLEFPVVFVPEIHKTFHLSDASRTMVVHPDYGFGLKYLNRKEHRKADTLLRRVLAEELTQESIAEEMRVLYVALTRAKKKLYLIGKEQKVSAVSRDAAGRLSVSDLATSRNYLRWILPAFDCQSSVIRRIDPAEVIAEEESYDTMKRNERIQKLLSLLDNCDAAHLSEIRSVLEWEDPYADQALLPKKVSVSDLKREAYEARIQQLSDDPQIPPAAPDGDAFAKDAYVPAFAREQLPKSGAFYGSAFHRFMQCVDFRAFDGIDARKTEEILRAQIRILSESGRIDAETKDALRIRQLTDFILSGTGKRMIRAACAGTLRREQPFVMQIPGGFAGQDTEDDPEMITQGIIDAFWEEEDGFVLLDYKTDALDDEAELLKRYELQMRLYQEALSRAIDPKPLKETILYSVRMGKAIPFV